MKIFTDNPEGSTVIRNFFIDQYMPHANGEFVKVYLYLLRCANSGRDISVSSIADVFEYTEMDVRRAITYWEKQDLLRTRVASDGTIESVMFNESHCLADAADSGKEDGGDDLYSDGMSGFRDEPKNDEPVLPEVKLSQLSKHAQKELHELFEIAGQYLKRPLSSAEQQEFVYDYNTLKFSTDLIEYLLEYCIMRGVVSCPYMRKVATEWAKEGIKTVQEAKEQSIIYNQNYYSVLKAFGIRDRNPAPAEQEAIDHWLNEYGFSMDIILEACRRTVLKMHNPNFDYVEGILRDWHNRGIHSIKEIEELDQKHQQDQNNEQNNGKKIRQGHSQRSAGNRFNNFSQREYDYSEMERKLLNQQ